MIAKVLVELIGTFVFLSVILSKGEAIPIAVALAAVIFLGGGHYNPLVTLTQSIAGKVPVLHAILLVATQLAATGAAYGFVNYLPK